MPVTDSLRLYAGELESSDETRNAKAIVGSDRASERQSLEEPRRAMGRDTAASGYPIKLWPEVLWSARLNPEPAGPEGNSIRVYSVSPIRHTHSESILRIHYAR